MKYKQKARYLSVLVGVLALIYAVALIFDPQRVQSRAAAYTWIDPQWLPQAERLEISGPTGTVSLVRRNALWLVEKEGVEYPAKNLRVEDFLKVLPYPVRSSSAAAPAKLGLTEGTASRVLIRGGPGQPLLDLLAGGGDATGNEIYLRKNGGNEVRSGEDRFSVYLNGNPSSWYDLKLFPPPSSGRSPGPADVQRFTLDAPFRAGGEDAPAPAGSLVITRSGNGWVLGATGGPALDAPTVESYLRSVFDAEGEDFNRNLEPAEPVFTEGSLALELGDGSRRSLRLGPPSAEGRRSAAVSGSPYVYELAGWTVDRLFRDAAYFVQP